MEVTLLCSMTATYLLPIPILSAVSLGIYDTNVKYKLSIYKDPDAGNPTSGTLAATQSGTMPGYAGYYTIPLEKQISGTYFFRGISVRKSVGK